jgi:hypothetical protein
VPVLREWGLFLYKMGSFSVRCITRISRNITRISRTSQYASPSITKYQAASVYRTHRCPTPERCVRYLDAARYFVICGIEVYREIECARCRSIRAMCKIFFKKCDVPRCMRCVSDVNAMHTKPVLRCMTQKPSTRYTTMCRDTTRYTKPTRATRTECAMFCDTVRCASTPGGPPGHCAMCARCVPFLLDAHPPNLKTDICDV